MPSYKVHFFRYSAVDDDFDGSRIIIFVRAYQNIFKLYYHSHVYTDQRLEFYERCLKVLRANNRDEAENDIIDMLVTPFKPWIENMVVAIPARSLLLHDYLYVTTHVLHAVADINTTDEFKAVPKGPIIGRAYRARGLPLTPCHRDSLTWCPVFTSKDVQLPESEPEAGYFSCLESPDKVLVGDIVCSLRQFSAYEVENEARTHEFDTYRKIAHARASGDLPETVRITTRLHGLVVDNKACIPRAMMAARSKPSNHGPRLIGMLMEQPSSDQRTLWDAARHADCTDEQRRTWAGELGGIITQLHFASIIWGDVKPDNVIVDDDDQLWITEFGGGYTPRWVDHENKMSMAGDLQGLERIQTWLFRV